MQKILTFGAAALILGFSAVTANAQQQTRSSYCPPSAGAVREGHAPSIVENFPLHYFDNGYHDPKFSSQQDQIYDGRF